jgi:multiple sugar transport system permease protein
VTHAAPLRAAGRRRIPWRSIGLTLVAVAVSVYLLAPFAWLVLTSIMRESEALSVPPHWIPHEPTLANYKAFFSPDQTGHSASAQAIGSIGLYLRNSFTVALGVSILNLVVGTMAAYALARLDFRGSHALVLFYLASRMVPSVAILIPMYLVMLWLDLLDSLFSLILAYTTFTLPFTIWVLRSYFQTIPRDLEDAARVDRCGWLRMMLHVFLPVATPALVAAAMFAFMASWSEFLYAVIFTSTEASKTLTVAISQFATEFYIEKTLMTAGGVVAVLPPLVLALVFQRLIVQGLVSGSVKG